MSMLDINALVDALTVKSAPSKTASDRKTLGDIVHNGVHPKHAGKSVTVNHQDRGGFTLYEKRKVKSIFAPLRFDDAHARTVRIHELLHANCSPPCNTSMGFHPMADNAIEDIRVQYVYWPAESLPSRANRDALAVAFRDMRETRDFARTGALIDNNNWNKALLYAARAMAIVHRLGDGNHHERIYGLIDQTLTAGIRYQLAEIIEMATVIRTNKGKEAKFFRRKALEKYQSLMRLDKPKTPGNGNGKLQGGTDANAKSESNDNPMRITRLPMPCYTNSSQPRVSLSRNGSRINRGRLANAIATGNTAGLFVRRRQLTGGSILFDVSGSMDLSADQIHTLCNAAPAATVAYYSGWGRRDAADGAWGELVIYAAGGQRANEVTNVHGNNSVDYWAIKWLLEQDGPRIYVGDGGFCGGPDDQATRTVPLIGQAVASGKLLWLKSVDELLKFIK